VQLGELGGLGVKSATVYDESPHRALVKACRGQQSNMKPDGQVLLFGQKVGIKPENARKRTLLDISRR
jgi:hypothetical protein